VQAAYGGGWMVSVGDGVTHVPKAMIAALLILAAAIQPSNSTADDWPGPVTLTRFSDDSRFFVRIIPGQSIGDTVGFAGLSKGGYAHALFYARQPDASYRLVRDAALLNPVGPVDAVVNKSGHLITLDNWHNLGYGKVLAVYDAAGRPVRSYDLEQLYAGERIKKLRESESSRYWRCAPVHFVDPAEQSQLYIREALGGYFVLTIASGAVAYHVGNITDCVPPDIPRR